jgi:hypothetical protein
MFTIKINFCNSNGFLLKNKRNVFNIFSKLNNDYNINPLNLYYKNYNNIIENKILSKNTFSCFEYIGKKYLLYLNKYKNCNYVFLIENDMKNKEIPKIISIPLIINDQKLFEDTIYDGEMIKYKNRWYFYIEKCLLFKKKIVKNSIESLKLCYELLYKYNEFGLEPFQLRIKQFFTPEKIQNQIKESKFKLLNINFYCNVNYPIKFYFSKKFNQNNKVLKIKNFPRASIDLVKKKNNILKDYNNTEFLNNTYENLLKLEKKYSKNFNLMLKKTEFYGIFKLFAKNDKFISIARINNIEKRAEVNKFFQNKDTIFVSCNYDYPFKKFKVINISNNYQLDNYFNIKKYIN